MDGKIWNDLCLPFVVFCFSCAKLESSVVSCKMSTQRMPLPCCCIQGDEFKALFKDAGSCWFELIWNGSSILNKISNAATQSVLKTQLSKHRNTGSVCSISPYIENIGLILRGKKNTQTQSSQTGENSEDNTLCPVCDTIHGEGAEGVWRSIL